LALLALLAFATAGCAGSQSKANGEENAGDAKPADSAAADDPPKADKADKPADKGSSKHDDDLNEAQKEQMEIALRRGGEKASNCDRVVAGTVTGEGEVKVTFDGKKGRAVDVSVGPPWAGTDAESCIKRSFIGEIIVPFDGQLEVPYPVKIGKKATADDKSTKPKKGAKKP
jgi:hypothetical protein